MRVTKIIREYVEKTVTNALPFGAPREDYIAADRELNDLRDRLEEQVDTYAKELLAGIDNLPEGFTIKRTHNCIFSVRSVCSFSQSADNF